MKIKLKPKQLNKVLSHRDANISDMEIPISLNTTDTSGSVMIKTMKYKKAQITEPGRLRPKKRPNNKALIINRITVCIPRDKPSQGKSRSRKRKMEHP